MKKYVRITSMRTLEIYPSSMSVDMTNDAARVVEQFKPVTNAVRFRVLIKEGTFDYPAVIQDWPVMNSLIRDKVITIGTESDTTDSQDAIDTLERLKEGAKYFKTVAKTGKASKKDIAVADAILNFSDAEAVQQ